MPHAEMSYSLALLGTWQKTVSRDNTVFYYLLMLYLVFPTVPGLPGRVGKDGRAWRLSCVKTAVLWVNGRALQAQRGRELLVGPGRHL